jgi:DNA-binding SARP family transcriptional activator/tetratricopeptide (TPR) repeat protein
LKFRILGSLDVQAHGGPVVITGHRQQKLLALLVLNAGQVIDDQRVIRELWDDPPPSARQQVHNAISSLRRTLGRADENVRITRTELGYRFEIRPEQRDVHSFLKLLQLARTAESQGEPQEAIDRFHEALELWRGDALAGLDGYEITSAAANLDEQRLSAIEDVTALRLRQGEAGSMLGQLRQLVAAHPLRETLRGYLIQALNHSSLQADALAVYDEGRRILADELGIDPSAQLRRLHASILAGEAEAAPARPGDEGDPAAAGAGPPEPDRRRRFYLPHDIGDFSGRTAELAKLLAGTRVTPSNAVVISVIDGMGGVGKTTLAIHLAHRIADRYPDGQYFVDLHGFSPRVDPVSPEQALDTLLRDSGVPPELIPQGTAARSALWRSQTAGRRVLLVLDNAIDAQHVRPLLPATAEQLVIVTSRRKLAALGGTVPLPLDVPSPRDAIELFNQVAGRDAEADPDAVAAVVELGGRLPLAIRIAAARLRGRPAWSVADLMDRLTGQDQRTRFLEIDNQSVAAVLRLSYRSLKPEQRLVFRLLGAHPGADFDAHAVAAVAELPLGRAEYLLDSLYDDNLVKQRTAGRFYFHDLVKDCARQIFLDEEDAEGRRLVTARLFDYYLHCAFDWCRHLDGRVPDVTPGLDFPPRETKPARSATEAVDLLRAEHDNFTSVAHSAAEQGSHRHALQLPWALLPLWRLDNNYGSTSYTLFRNGLRAAKALGHVPGEMTCLQGLALIQRERKANTEAKEHLGAALKLSRELGKPNDEAAQLLEFSHIHVDEDQLTQAIDVLTRASLLLPPGSTEHPRTAIANSLGKIYRDLGKFDLAMRQLGDALALAEWEDHPRRRMLTMWCIGTVLHYQGEHRQALAQFGEVLESSTAEKFEHGRALAMLGLADSHRRLGSSADAVRFGREALALARKFALWKIECEALNILGEAHLGVADTATAKRSFEHAHELAAHHRSRRYQARSLEGLAHVAMAEGKTTQARRQWRASIRLYPEGMVDAGFARHHLESLDAVTRCFRCSTGTPGAG